RLQIKPYSLVRAEQTSGPPGDRNVQGEVGLDVLKWGLTSNLTLDLTANTDFAQVEADVQQVNLTRFSLFFPEKRDFFLENAGLFQFGASTQADVFFSRRIGLSRTGEPIPLLGGVRLTGRMRRTSLGLLDVVQEEHGSEPRTNFSVLRVRHDILSRSSVGMIVTDREGEGPGGGNRVAGADTHMTFHQDYNLDFFYAASRSSELRSGGVPRDPEDPPRSGSAWRLRLGRDGDIWQYAIRHQRIDPGFDPEIGFVPRRDAIWSEGVMAWKPRPENSPVRQFVFLYNPIYITDHTGKLETRDHLLLAETSFQTGDLLGATYEEPFESLAEDFSLDPFDVVIPAGDYPMRQGSVYFNTFQGRRVASSFTASAGTFFGGRKTTLTEELTAKLSPHFAINTRYEYDRVRLPGGDFDVNLWVTRLNVALSPKLFGSALVQVDDIHDDVSLNLRVDWIHHPGADLFFVYNESRNVRAKTGEPGLNARDSTVKLTYLFHF
ncbi:MAG TPA: DUF5916 domain-containing protein, partial [Candidatus Polarisedimenticolia bacterium]|nr:DUF5916 domain-containing protein [Candidatus Polarisedimenticolia bacterium]